MATLTSLFPDPDVLLALPPEELGPIILRLAFEARPNGPILPNDVEAQVNGNHAGQNGYPVGKRPDAYLALSEAWNWLKVHGLVVPTDPSAPWLQVTRRGAALMKTGEFAAFTKAAAFPKSLLHPKIADAVWLDLARGDFETAIFRAFKTLEIAAREAAGLSASDYGVDLMRKAFHPTNGPLTDMEKVPSEREAVSALFAGAMGCYRNPNTHRELETAGHSEVQEIVMLASHLLRIVDSRRKS